MAVTSPCYPTGLSLFSCPCFPLFLFFPPGESPLETGTPRGLPSLTGFVINEGLIAGDEAA